MKFLDLFSGIGGFRLGMEQAGHECVGFCEIDKFARKSYKEIHNTKGEMEWHDITRVSNDDFRLLRGRVDIICGGFPCQAFSIAGKRKGFEDTRGTLFFEIARAVEEIEPRYLFLENVKGLLSHEGGQTFGTILSTLDELGYDVEWQVLNSKNFGVPQNRERVFIVGHSRKFNRREIFPIRGTNGCVGAKINRIAHNKNYRRISQTYDIEGSCEALDTMQGGGRQPCVVIKEATKQGYAIANEGDSINLTAPGSKTRRGGVGKKIANTLDTNCNQGVLNGFKIRKLTPKECWRLQGFPDWAFEKAEKVNSNSQLYKQAGNSVTVNVIYEIARKLKENKLKETGNDN